jgi:hypothetical protein
VPVTFDMCPYRTSSTIVAVLLDELIAEIESHLSS